MSMPSNGWDHRLKFTKVRHGKKRALVSKQLLREICDDNGAGIAFGNSYAAIDTIGVMFKGDIPKDLLEELKKSTFLGNVRIRRWPVKMSKVWKLLICLHQPTPLTFKLLRQFDADAILLVRLDICLDITTKTVQDALKLADFLVRHLYQKGASRLPKASGSVVYTNRANGGKNIATYGDRRSKFCSLPCAHIEFRFQNAEILRRNNLASIDAVLNLNFYSFWVDHLQMIAPLVSSAQEMLEEQLKRNPRIVDNLASKWYLDPIARFYQLLKRSVSVLSLADGFSEVIPANESWTFERNIMRKKEPKLMDNTAFLPTHVARYRYST